MAAPLTAVASLSSSEQDARESWYYRWHVEVMHGAECYCGTVCGEPKRERDNADVARCGSTNKRTR
jgi:hypothetical protein